MTFPLVSIIVPVYNQDKRLFNICLDSVFRQDYDNIELVLVDDGSTDGTAEYCDKLVSERDNIVVIHKNNQRQGAARNAALDICKGDYVFFLDSDDWIESNTISTLVDLIESYSADIAVCGCFKQTSDGKIHKDHKLQSELRVLNNYEALYSYVYNTPYCTHSPCDKLYARRLFTHARFIIGSYYEDLGSVYKFVEQAIKVVYTNQQLYCYYDNHNSTMHKRFSIHEFDKVRIYHKLSEHFRYKSGDDNYQSFVKQMDRETLYCAIGYICKTLLVRDKSLFGNTIRQTQQICKEIRSDIGWKLKLVSKLIAFNPMLFKQVWKTYNRISN